MKALVTRVLVSGALVVLSVGAAFAQDKTSAGAASNKYVISANAGGVNFVEGSTAVDKKSGTGGLLLKGDTLEIGDRVSTGADGKAEILLNPGSFLRIGGDSTFEFASTSLDDLKIKLERGSAIFEVFADDEFRVAVITPKSDFHLIRSGIYRIDVNADGTGSIEVWKGRAQVGDSRENIVKSGREGNLENGALAVAKFDRDEKDEFELWSKDRAKDMARSVARLQRKVLRTSLMDSFNGRRWNMYDSFGLWVYDPYGRSYSFLPFGFGWTSPYGYGYNGYIGGYNLPPAVYTPPQRTAGSTPSGGTPTTAGAPRQEPRTTMPGDRGRSVDTAPSVPVYIRMQGGGNDGGVPIYDPDSGAKGRGRQIDSPMTPAPVRDNSSAAPARGSSPQRSGGERGKP